MPTTNPVPSYDPTDLLFNAQKLDEVVNGTANSFTDRLGIARRTVAGMNADFDAQLADAESDLNVYRADAAASAAEALGYLQTIRATSYGALASDPATDPLGNPCTVGDEYFNTTLNQMRVYTGSAWMAQTTPADASAVSYQPAGTGAVATTVQEVMRRSVNIVDFMTPGDRTSNFLAPGSVDVTYASNLAITHLLTLGGGEVEMPSGVFKLNLVIPEGVVFSGKSSANILTNDPKGTKLIAANSALPVVKINGSTFISGAGLRGVCIDAEGTQTGLYIAGCAYINIDKVSVINAAHTNILIECLENLPTYFIFLNSVTTYNAASYNFRVLENLALGGTFTTSIFCSNFISYTLPGKTTAGRIAYIQAQVIASGYWEDRGDDIIVIDRGGATTPGGLTGKGLVIDGETGKNSIKIIPVPDVASYQRINSYICGNVSIDGNIYNSVTGDSVMGPIGNIEADYTISGLRKATHKHPLIIGSDSGFSYRFYDSTAKALRQKVTAPTSASDGNVISGAEAAYVAAPTTGSWVKGDVVFNANPFRGGVSGWVCIASGTPGTWETFGTVGAVENVASLPTPDSSQRGRMVTVLAGAGTADKIYICLRSAATTYSWVQVAAG